MITIRMIAEECGVSIAAVSRALNHQAGISPERAEFIRETARRMGYQPNEAARQLKTNRSKNIGILYYNMLTHEFFAAVLEAIQEEAAKAGYEITFLQNNSEMSYYEHALRRQCAGVIVAQAPYQRESMQPILDSGMPLISIEFDQPGHTVVRNDNVAAMEELVRHVNAMGHERIAFIHGDACQVTSERLTGFYRGCRDCGLAVQKEYILAGHFRHTESAEEATQRLLSLPKPPTCILFPDDIGYLGGLSAIESRGLRVPQDISCVGFGGIGILQLMRTKLTTYDQNAHEIGRTAVREIIAAIEDPQCYVPHSAVVDGRLAPGGTVLKLR